MISLEEIDIICEIVDEASIVVYNSTFVHSGTLTPGATEVITLKKKYPDIVFFGVGFETTAPMTGFLLKNNVCIYTAIRKDLSFFILSNFAETKT